KIRVAVVSYSGHVKLEFNFHKCKSRNVFRQEVDKISYVGRMTATGNALEFVRTSLIFNQAAGARKNVPKIIFVLTDGFSNRGVSPSVPATSLKNSEVSIFVMGITKNTNMKELKSIASTPTLPGEKFVYRVDSYEALQDIIKLLKTM
uniref:vWA domain-containing protein n=1 Tax=Salmonella sp. s54925 TaxID=3159674 RepID=UPI00397EAB7D